MSQIVNFEGISHLAHIHPEAVIGKNVSIGPFTAIDKDVVIGDNTWIAPNVTIFEGARIGQNCRIFPGAVISGIPQDLKFQGEYTTAEIGDYTTIREYVTVNRGTSHRGKTVVGSHCLLMAYVHVAHDCILGNHLILANSVNLAGHVVIDDYAILEGLVAVQQFVHIGAHSFIAGASLVRKNVPPYVKAAREPLAYVGVNTIGLRRRGFSNEVIQHIQQVYRYIFVLGYNKPNAFAAIQQNMPASKYSDEIIGFIQNSPKGIMKGFQTISQNQNGHQNGIGERAAKDLYKLK